MSDDEKFLGRWSRRKQEAAKLDKGTPADASGNDASKSAPTPGSAPEKDTHQPVSPLESPKEVKIFDVSSLPPIDSITATTDIRPFLAPGVPAELTRAALRKAWRSDPAIRDFVGLSENSWDFNDPTSMHGFGPLQLTDELKQIAMQMLGPARDTSGTSQPPEGQADANGPEAGTPQARGSAQERIDANSGDEKNNLSSTGIFSSRQADAATQREPRVEKQSDFKPKAKHGSALPRK